MMNPRFLLWSAVSALAACGTPQEQCIRAATRELGTLDRLIAEVEGNLRRGYAYETREITRTQWVICEYVPNPENPDRPSPRYCLDDVTDTVRITVAIDPAAERRKLDGLKAKRAERSRAAASEVARCRATYPE
jgi:hypothetical protein